LQPESRLIDRHGIASDRLRHGYYNLIRHNVRNMGKRGVGVNKKSDGNHS